MAKKGGARAPAGDVIDVPPADPDVALATTEGQSITQFIGGMVAFFTDAKDLERRAKEDLSAARNWQKPTNKDEDAILCASIRQNAVDTKAIEDHWTITALVHRFQRRLVAHRDRAISTRDEVKQIGNNLHNAYEADERRRVALENERIRQEQERQAQAQRDRELADLENQALRAEAASPDLSEREQRFVDYYNGSNAPAAARQAGFRGNHDEAAWRLLGSAKVIAAIEARRQAEAIRAQAKAVKQAPLERSTVTPVKEQVASRAVTTYSAEVVDEDVFMAAVLDPMTRARLGIPSDIATYKQTKLTECAKALQENIERWPGVRLKKTTGVR
jgi:hypothetical protein